MVLELAPRLASPRCNLTVERALSVKRVEASFFVRYGWLQSHRPTFPHTRCTFLRGRVRKVGVYSSTINRCCRGREWGEGNYSKAGNYVCCCHSIL